MPSNPALSMLVEKGLGRGSSPLMQQQDQPQRSCHLQLFKQPDNGGTMPNERKTFTPSSILFRPHIWYSFTMSIISMINEYMHKWWRRRVPPPGPIGLLRSSFIVIARYCQQYKYSNFSSKRKEASRGQSHENALALMFKHLHWHHFCWNLFLTICILYVLYLFL